MESSGLLVVITRDGGLDVATAAARRFTDRVSGAYKVAWIRVGGADPPAATPSSLNVVMNLSPQETRDVLGSLRPAIIVVEEGAVDDPALLLCAGVVAVVPRLPHVPNAGRIQVVLDRVDPAAAAAVAAFVRNTSDVPLELQLIRVSGADALAVAADLQACRPENSSTVQVGMLPESGPPVPGVRVHWTDGTNGDHVSMLYRTIFGAEAKEAVSSAAAPGVPSGVPSDVPPGALPVVDAGLDPVQVVVAWQEDSGKPEALAVAGALQAKGVKVGLWGGSTVPPMDVLAVVVPPGTTAVSMELQSIATAGGAMLQHVDQGGDLAAACVAYRCLEQPDHRSTGADRALPEGVRPWLTSRDKGPRVLIDVRGWGTEDALRQALAQADLVKQVGASTLVLTTTTTSSRETTSPDGTVVVVVPDPWSELEFLAFDGADLYVHASPLLAGLHIAAGLGCPVLASHTPSSAAVVHDLVTGWLVPDVVNGDDVLAAATSVRDNGADMRDFRMTAVNMYVTGPAFGPTQVMGLLTRRDAAPGDQASISTPSPKFALPPLRGLGLKEMLFNLAVDLNVQRAEKRALTEPPREYAVRSPLNVLRPPRDPFVHRPKSVSRPRHFSG